jgi:hypothetical protein
MKHVRDFHHVLQSENLALRVRLCIREPVARTRGRIAGRNCYTSGMRELLDSVAHNWPDFLKEEDTPEGRAEAG